MALFNPYDPEKLKNKLEQIAKEQKEKEWAQEYARKKPASSFYSDYQARKNGGNQNSLVGITPTNIKDRLNAFHSPKESQITSAEHISKDAVTFSGGDDSFWGATKDYADAALKGVGRAVKNTLSDYLINQQQYGEFSANDPTLQAAKSVGLLEDYSFDKYTDIAKKNEKNFLNTVREGVLQAERDYQQIQADHSKLSENQMVWSKRIGDTAGMVPAVTAGLISPTAGTGVLLSQAYGGAFEEALGDGANADEARSFALASAVTEVSIEKIAGGIPGVGKGFLGDVASKFISNSGTREVIRHIVDTVGEGGEEVATAFITPYLKRAIYDPNAKLPTMDDYKEVFLGGVTGSAILGGAPQILSRVGSAAIEAGTNLVNKRINTQERIDARRLDKIDKAYQQMSGNLFGGMQGIDARHSVSFEDIVNYKPGTRDSMDGVKYSVSNAGDTEVYSIKEQIKNKTAELEKMSPVFDEEVHVQNRGKTLNKEWVMNLLSKFGYKVNRNGLGAVIIDKKRVGKSLSYLQTDGELAAYSALPYVVRDGVVIHGKENHKDRGYGTITIGAPVVINGVRGNMGVVIRQNDGDLYYKVHRILMPDGSSFLYENTKKSTAERAGAATDTVTSPTDSAQRSAETAAATSAVVASPTDNDSVISIPQNTENSNGILGESFGGTTTPQSAAPTAPLTQGSLGAQVPTEKLQAAGRVKEILTNVFGVQFKEYSGKSGIGGFYDPETRTIHINVNSPEPVLTTISHEFIHDFKVNDPEGYALLRQAVEKDMNLVRFNEYRTSLLEAYDEQGIDYKHMSEQELYEHVLEEACCDLMGEVMRDPATIKKIAKHDIGLAQKVIDGLQRIIDSITQAFPKWFGGSNAEIRGLVNNFEEVKRVYQTVVENSAKKGSRSEGVPGEVKYSTVFDFRHQVDDALDEKLGRSYSVYAGSTSNLLQKCGLDDLPMLMNQSHLRDINKPKSQENRHWHGLSRDAIKQIPEQLKHPVMIYDSISETNKENAVCVLTSLRDSDGLPVIIAVKANSQGNNRYFDVSFESATAELSNFIASAYGREGFKYHIESILEQDALLYANKNKTLKLFSDIGLELPERLNNLGFDTIIHQSRNIVKNNIRQNFKNDTSDGVKLSVLRNGSRSEGVPGEVKFSTQGKKGENILDNGSDSVVEYNQEIENQVLNSMKIRRVKAKQFPRGHGKEPHAISTRWAYRDGVKNGAKHIVYVGNRCYVIEKFENVDFKYQIIGTVNYQEYQNAAKEVKKNANDGERESAKTMAANYGERFTAGDRAGGERSGFNGYDAEYGAENRRVRRMDETEDRGRVSSGDTSRSYESSLGNRRGRLVRDGGRVDDGGLSGLDSKTEDAPDGVKFSVSRKKRAEDAMAQYNESGDLRDLPDRAWTSSYVRDTKNRSAYLYNQRQTLEYQKKYADAESRHEIESAIAALDKKIAKANEGKDTAVALQEVLDNATLNRNINLAPVISDLHDVDTGLKIKNGNYRFNDFYRNMERFFGAHFHLVRPLVDAFDKAKGDFARLQVETKADMHRYIVKELGIKKGSLESKAVQWIAEGERNPRTRAEKDERERVIRQKLEKGEITQAEVASARANYRAPYTKAMLYQEFGREKAEKILKAEDWFRSQYDALIDEINKTQRMIYPTRPDKLVPKRPDYMRHFREMETGFTGLLNIATGDSNISPSLVTVSDHTKPKEKWASIKQMREGKATDEGAIEGFMDYLPQAAYSIYINPYIDKFRGLSRDIAEFKEASGETNANGFIKYLSDFANHLAGKSSGIDRALIDSLGSNGRKMMKTLNWFNNRVKGNAVLGNLGSTAKQVMNLPNGVKLLENPAGILNGIIDMIKAAGREGGIRQNWEKSDFLTERFLDKGDMLFKKNGIGKGAQWLLGAADEFGTRAIWNAAYREGVALSENGEIDQTPERYADILTRKAVAGRGVGEVPLEYQTQFGKLILPFQIEVSNSWNVDRDVLQGKSGKGDKNALSRAGRMVLGYLVTWGLGAALEELLGSAGAFNPLDDIFDGIMQGFEEEKEGDTFDKIVRMVQRSAQNVAGDFIGNRSFGWLYGELLSAIDEDWAENMFNGSVMSQGINVPAVQSLGKVAKDYWAGDYVGGTAELVTSFVTPFGGKQLDKSIRGAADYVHGGKYENDIYRELSTGERGEKRYDIEQNVPNALRSVIGGPSSLKESAEYWSGKDASSRTSSREKKQQEKAGNDFIKSYKKEHPDGEVMRLYNEIKRKDVFPFEAVDRVQSFTDNGKKQTVNLTEQQLQSYQEKQNELMEQLYQEVVAGDAYRDADAYGKMELLEEARKEAESYTRVAIKNDNLYSKPVSKLLTEGDFREVQYKSKLDVAPSAESKMLYDRSMQVMSFASSLQNEGLLRDADAEKLFNYLIKEPQADGVDKEVYRINSALGKAGAGGVDVSGSYASLLTFTKNKQTYRIPVSAGHMVEVVTAVDSQTRRALSQLFNTSAYQNASIQKKKELIQKEKDKVRTAVKEGLKKKFAPVRVDDFDKITRMK